MKEIKKYALYAVGVILSVLFITQALSSATKVVVHASESKPASTLGSTSFPASQINLTWVWNFELPDGEYNGWINENDQRHGFGWMYYSDGKTYEGMWNKDAPAGYGTLIYGDEYQPHETFGQTIHASGIYNGTLIDGATFIFKR